MAYNAFITLLKTTTNSECGIHNWNLSLFLKT
jgi:hypothetical protein